MKKRHYTLAAGLAAGIGFLVPWKAFYMCSRTAATDNAVAPDAATDKRAIADAGASFDRDGTLLYHRRDSSSAAGRNTGSLNELLTRLYSCSPLCESVKKSAPSEALPQGYRIEESIPLGDEPLEKLSALFYDDCVGRCLYINDGGGMVTKVRAPKSDQPLEWYDEVSNCIRFTGEFWLYLEEESGTIKAWGTNQGSKTGATRLALPCE